MVGVNRDMLAGIFEMGMKHVANEIFKN